MKSKRRGAKALPNAVRARETGSDASLIAKVCWYHFREGQTQQHIADRVGFSRMTINKIISDALKRGYVRISVETPQAPYFELEARLVKALGFKEAIVAPPPENEEEVRSIVGYALGDYISRKLPKGQVLGLAWGGTIYAAAQVIEPRTDSGNVVVSLSGGLSRGSS